MTEYVSVGMCHNFFFSIKQYSDTIKVKIATFKNHPRDIVLNGNHLYGMILVI